MSSVTDVPAGVGTPFNQEFLDDFKQQMQPTQKTNIADLSIDYLSEIAQLGVKHTKKQQEFARIPNSSKCCLSTTLSTIQAIALFIISCIAVFSGVSNVAMGGVAIGLGAGMILTHLCRGDVRKNKMDHIVAVLGSLSLIALGALGISRVMSASKLGLSLIGAQIAFATVAKGHLCIEANCTKEGKERKEKVAQSMKEYQDELKAAKERYDAALKQA